MCWLCRAQGPADAVATNSALWAEAAQPTAPRLDLMPTGDAGIDGLRSGFAWADGDPVSFAFPDSASDYEAYYGASAQRAELVATASAGPWALHSQHMRGGL